MVSGTRRRRTEGWLLFVLPVVITAVVCYFGYRELSSNFIATEKHLVHEPGHPGELPWHQVLYEGTSILGVSAAILVAGLAIAGPLYISLVQSMTDSVFQTFTFAYERHRGELDPERKHVLEVVLADLKTLLVEIEDTTKINRVIFQIALRMGALLLVVLAIIIAFWPQEESIYILSTGSVIVSLVLATTFSVLVIRITQYAPIQEKLQAQVRLADMLIDASKSSKAECAAKRARGRLLKQPDPRKLLLLAMGLCAVGYFSSDRRTGAPEE